MFKEYAELDATGLAELIASRQVSAAEVLEAALARCESMNPQLNAICIPMFAQARARAKTALQGPFAGVPLLIKDAAQDYAGELTTQGSRALRAARAPAHATIVQRWLDAGFVIFGKTATPELCLKGITESKLWGPTRNPWDQNRTPGGSSGGAAAAVAAGIVPVAGASDGGGSIRIPASFCGLFGLRPSRGRITSGPGAGEMWDGASSDHVLTRSVRDSAAILDATAGAGCGDPFVIAPPAESYTTAAQREPRRLRIGYSTVSPLDTPVDPSCIDAVNSAVALLRQLGHDVEPAAPKIDGHALAHSYLTMYFGQVAASVAEARALTGATDSEFEEDTRALALIGRTLSAGDYVQERKRWNEYARALGEFHTQYDLYLTPTVANLPARIGELDLGSAERLGLKAVLRLGAGRALHATGILKHTALKSLARTPFTQLSNLTGTPSMSVPLHQTAEGLPMGVQFVAPFGAEALLFSLAGQLERARPWAGKRAQL